MKVLKAEIEKVQQGQTYTCVRLSNLLWSKFGLGSKEYKANFAWLKKMNSLLNKDGILTIPDLKLTLKKVSDTEFTVI